jgi:hypothetical protein
MVAVVLVIAIVLIVVGIAAIAMSAARGGGSAKVAATAHVFVPVRPSSAPLASALGTIEVAKPAPAPASPLFDLDLEPDPDPAPDVASAASEIRWCQQFDPRSGALDETARLRLIGDLGVVAKEWCVLLLCRAYEEERRPANRQAALIALAACNSRTAIPTYRLALASGDPEERAIAADALADLEPPSKSTARTVVERH